MPKRVTKLAAPFFMIFRPAFRGGLVQRLHGISGASKHGHSYCQLRGCEKRSGKPAQPRSRPFPDAAPDPCHSAPIVFVIPFLSFCHSDRREESALAFVISFLSFCHSDRREESAVCRTPRMPLGIAPLSIAASRRHKLAAPHFVIFEVWVFVVPASGGFFLSAARPSAAR
jgi:hypothetical protein